MSDYTETGYYITDEGETKIRVRDPTSGHIHIADATESSEQGDTDKAIAEAIAARAVMDNK